MATRKRGCTGSLSIITASVVGAGVAVTAGMNLCLVGVGAAVAGAGAAVAGAGALVAGAAVAAGTAVGAIVGAAVGAIVGAMVGAGAGAAVGAAVAAGVSSSSSPQATITIAITATNDNTASICHLLIQIGVFTIGPPRLSQKLHCRQASVRRPLESSDSAAC